MKRKTIKEYVTAVHPYSIYSYERTRNNGTTYTLWATEVYDSDGKRNKIQCMELDGLYEKLYSFYDIGSIFLRKNTLAKHFNAFLEDKKLYISNKSVMEYRRLWTKYYANEPIVTKDLNSLTVKDFRNFFV
ncbi:MAG: hypothetical protein HUJ76_12175 [Parasporobacterium sp.]|nr:hypothetical protein [Parasporobacterium sp.]